MDIAFLIRGLAIGFAVAAPVGAIGLLCIRRTLADGRLVGFASGLGAATADALYGLVAALGLTAISAALAAHQDVVRLVGGLFLCWLGVRTATAPVATSVEQAGPPGAWALARAYATTFSLTLTNPGTILSFVAVFAGLGLADAGTDRGSAALLVSGVFLGSAVWWLALSTGVGLTRRALTAERLRWVNRASGALLAGFGLVAMVGAVR